MAYTAIVIIPVSISGFVITLENSMPFVLYDIVSVAINMAGNAAIIPPNTGHPAFAMKTVNITAIPPNADRTRRCFPDALIFQRKQT